MSNVYRIGVAIAMSSNGAAVLGQLSRHLLGVHAQTNQLTGGMNRLKLAIGGAMAVGVGVAIVKSFGPALEEAAKFERAVTKFGNFGLGPARTKEAADFAKQMKITGQTYVDNMTRMSEAQGVFRESGLDGSAALRGAKLAAPMLAKIDFATRALDPEKAGQLHAQSLAMLRFIEMRGGVNSPEKFNQIANAGFKAIQSSGGNIDWEQLRQFAARAGVAGQNLDDTALFGKLEPVIGELKGSTAGFALRTSYNRLNGIVKLPNQVAHELVNSGIWDGSKVTWNSQGGIKAFKGDPLVDQKLFAHDPVAFYEKYIMPMYAKMGLDSAGRARENSMIFGSTGGALFSLIDRQLPAIHHSVEAQRKARNVDEAYAAAQKTFTGRKMELGANMTNLKTNIGLALLPAATRGLEMLNGALIKLVDWTAKHPQAVAFFAKAALVVGAAFIGLGVAAVGVAAFAAVAAGGTIGLIVAGVTALVSAIAAFAALNWRAISGAVKFIFGIPSGTVAPQTAGTGRGGTGVPVSQAPAFTGRGAAQRAAAAGRARSAPATAPPRPMGRGQNGGGDVYLDKTKVGKVVAGGMAAGMNHANVSSGRPDRSASLPAAGAGYRR